MIIFNRPSAKKLAKKRRKIRGKKWWKSRTRILLAIYIFLLCGAIIGGGSALRKSIKRGKLQASIQKNIKQIKRRTTEINRYLRSISTPLSSSLYINIKFKDYQQIVKKREEALSRGYLLAEEDDFIAAILRSNSESIPVRLRLKGDLPEHWEGEKWSFRIHARKNKRFKGMRRFSIQDPKTRNYIYEWAFFENLRLENILAPRYDFVDTFVNGRHKGIYALEENFSKELLESQGRREGIIVRFSEDAMWRQWNNWLFQPGFDEDLGKPQSPAFFILQPKNWINSSLDIFGSTKAANDPVLLAQRDAALGLLEAYREGKKSASEVFDAPLLAKFLALTQLWGGGHGLDWANLRFYFNPITFKLEPIGFDSVCGNIQFEEADLRVYEGRKSEVFPLGWIDWLAQALHDELIAELYVRECSRVSKPEYLSQIQSKIESEAQKKLLILWRENPEIDLDWDILTSNQEFLRRVFNPVEQIVAYVNPESNRDAVSGNYLLQFNIGNLLTLPVEILGVKINDGEMIDLEVNSSGLSIPASNNIVLGSLNPFVNLKTEIFYLPISEELISNGIISADINIEVISRILGSPTQHETVAVFMPEPGFIKGLPFAPTISEILKRHPFISYVKESNEFYVKPGIWIVKRDIVLPKNAHLIIKENTVLKFVPGVVLIVNGRIFFEGSIEDPVELSAQDNSWGGLIVLDAQKSSRLENVVIKDVAAVERGGWILTGGVTFYQSPVIFNNVRIQNTYSEDAVNIVRSKFKITNSQFIGCISDAIDFDFSIGTIERTIFKNIKGDAIDASGTDLDVEKVNIISVGDKGISAGEKSKVLAKDVVIEDTDIGVASKDYSEVSIDNLKIQNCNIGLTAYQKKPEFGSASIDANNISFEDTKEEVLLQVGSRINVNGKDYQGQELDIGKLYQKDYQALSSK